MARRNRPLNFRPAPERALRQQVRTLDAERLFLGLQLRGQEIARRVGDLSIHAIADSGEAAFVIDLSASTKEALR